MVVDTHKFDYPLVAASIGRWPGIGIKRDSRAREATISAEQERVGDAGESVRLMRLMRLMGRISWLIHAGSAKLLEIADNIEGAWSPARSANPL
jgi:hypothetical protein